MKPRVVLLSIVCILVMGLTGLLSTAAAEEVAFGHGPLASGDIAVGQWLPIGSSPATTCPRCGHTYQLPYAVRAYDQFGYVTDRWTYQYAPIMQAPRYQWEYERQRNRQTFLRELPHVVPSK